MTDTDPWDHDADAAAPDAEALIDSVQHELEERPRASGLLGGDPHVVCWPALDPHAAEHELAVLRRWVEWLVARYSLDHRTVPPCWHQHGALLEELSAMYSLWQACFSDDASPGDPATFHQHLSLALMRLRDWAARRDCKPGHHRDDQPPVWPSCEAIDR